MRIIILFLVALFVVSVVILSCGVGPAVAWPESDGGGALVAKGYQIPSVFKIGARGSSDFLIPDGSALGGATGTFSMSALGFYSQHHWTVLGEFGAGTGENYIVGGVQFGYLLSGWVLPYVGLHARGVGSPDTPGIGPIGGLGFFVPLSDTGDKGMLIGPTVTSYGRGALGGTSVALTVTYFD